MKQQRANDSEHLARESRSTPDSHSKTPSLLTQRGGFYVVAYEQITAEIPVVPWLAMLEFASAGLPALQDGEPGQVWKEAATAVYCKCRGLGSPLSFLALVWGA